MPWGYRIIKRVEKHPFFGRTPVPLEGADWTPEPFPEFVTSYFLSEVFYNQDGSVYGFSGPVDMLAESPEELRDVLEMMGKAFEKPVLDETMETAPFDGQG